MFRAYAVEYSLDGRFYIANQGVNPGKNFRRFSPLDRDRLVGEAPLGKTSVSAETIGLYRAFVLDEFSLGDLEQFVGVGIVNHFHRGETGVWVL